MNNDDTFVLRKFLWSFLRKDAGSGVIIERFSNIMASLVNLLNLFGLLKYISTFKLTRSRCTAAVCSLFTHFNVANLFWTHTFGSCRLMMYKRVYLHICKFSLTKRKDKSLKCLSLIIYSAISLEWMLTWEPLIFHERITKHKRHVHIAMQSVDSSELQNFHKYERKLRNMKTNDVRLWKGLLQNVKQFNDSLEVSRYMILEARASWELFFQFRLSDEYRIFG